MTTFYDNSAIDPEPMQMLLIDGRPAFRRLGPDLPYGEKYEVAETIDRPMPRPCSPLPVCLEPPVFAEVPADVLAAPVTGTALPTDPTEAWYVPSAINAGYAPDGILTYGDVAHGDVIHEGDVIAGDTFTARHASFTSFTARPHGWQYDHPAPVPLPAAGLCLILAVAAIGISVRLQRLALTKGGRHAPVSRAGCTVKDGYGNSET